MTESKLPATTQSTSEKRELALMRALGLDKVPAEQRELALAIADRYELDPMLKHLVLIDGKPFITRDGLLHVAHRSGVFDGIEVSIPIKDGTFWRCTATVYRKDMGRGFTYPGRYPIDGGRNRAYAEEMAIKVAESMALRRAFDVAAPSADERFAEIVEPEPPARRTLQEIARQRAEAATTETGAVGRLVLVGEAVADAVSASVDAEPDEVVVEPEPEIVARALEETGLCGKPNPYEDDGLPCHLKAGHKRNHVNPDGETW